MNPSRLFKFSLFFYAVALPISISAVNAAIVLMVAAVLWGVRRKEVEWFLPMSLLPLVIFLFWASCTQWAAERSLDLADLNSYQKVWNLFPYLFIPMGARYLSGEQRNVFKTLAWVAAAVAILGAIEFWTGAHYFFEGWFNRESLVMETRFYGFQSHPLHTGALYTILFLSALSLAFFDASSIRERALWMFFACVFGVAVVLTGSRSYFAGLLVGAFVLGAMRGWKVVLGGAFALFLIVAILFKSNPNIENRIRTMSPNRMDESSHQRVYIWKSALLMIQEHPIAGVGYRQWKNALPAYAQRFPDWNMDPAAFSHAHNSFLTITAETGFLGLFLFLSYWVLVFREQFILLRKRLAGFSRALVPGTLAGLFALAAASASEHNLLTAIVFQSLFFAVGLSRLPASAEAVS